MFNLVSRFLTHHLVIHLVVYKIHHNVEDQPIFEKLAFMYLSDLRLNEPPPQKKNKLTLPPLTICQH